MKKRIITISLVIALLATCFAGTYAYLTDIDAAKNVMVLGNVDIEQNEYEREKDTDGNYVIENGGYKLKAFTQNKSLMPATSTQANGEPYNFGAGDWAATSVKMASVGSQGSMNVFSNVNAQDKFVVVKNTGKSDAYVRTLVALECGSKTAAEWDALIRTSCFMTDKGVWTWNVIGIANIVDKNNVASNYVVVEMIYGGGAHLGGVHKNGVLPAGETTYPGLCQVYMTAAATNADVNALDGNGNGLYDILVLSQAVQAEGFANAELALDTAFGDVTTTTAAAWLATVA